MGYIVSLERVKHWDTRAFDSFLAERASVPFAWGSNDCASFAGDGILANTGVDVMEDLRGYTTAVGAARKIASVTGGSTLQDAVLYVAGKYGLTEWPVPLLAKRGDLVLYEAEDGELAAGLVGLNGRDVLSPGEKGLQRFPLSLVRRAWTY